MRRIEAGRWTPHSRIVLVLTILLLSIAVSGATSPAIAASPTLDTGNGCTGSATSTSVSCQAGPGSGSTGNADLMLIEVVVVGTSPAISTPTLSTGGGSSGCPSGSVSARTTVTESASSPRTEVGEYYCVATSTVKHQTVTATFTGGTAAYIVVILISGESTTAPFPGSPVVASGVSGMPTTSVTSHTTDLTLVGFEGDQGAAAETAGSGFSIPQAVTPITGGTAALEYSTAPSTTCPSGCSVSFGAVATNWALIADAVASTTSIPDLPFGVFLVVAPVLVIYALLRRARVAKSLGRTRPVRPEAPRLSRRSSTMGSCFQQSDLGPQPFHVHGERP